MENVLVRCAQAVGRIDAYLLSEQKSDAYDVWLERYSKPPREHDDAFLFGKLVQAMFSGGMNGQVVDAWMPRMQRAFYEWDVQPIAQLSHTDVEQLATAGAVIANRPKLHAVVQNARTVVALVARYGSLGDYLDSFDSLSRLSEELVQRFTFLGSVTVEDFLRNVGFDTAKPDRHLTRWLTRMGAVDAGATVEQVLNVSKRVAEVAQLPKARFDAAIYLFCADRDDVISGGVCGSTPRCGACPVADLCPQELAYLADDSPKHVAVRTHPKKDSGPKQPTSEPTANSVWDTCYPGLSLEEVQCINPFAIETWIKETFGINGSRERRTDIIQMFDGQNEIGEKRIKELGRNKGRYPAFRAIVHGYAVWENGVLRRSEKLVSILGLA